MTPIICADNIAQFLKEKLQNYKSINEKVVVDNITVQSGFLPRTKTKEEKNKYCPYVIVKPVKVFDDIENHESNVLIQLLVTLYDDDLEQGHTELYHLLEFCRQQLLENKTIARKNRLLQPVTTYVPEEQPFPVWLGYMELTYSVPQPQERFD